MIWLCFILIGVISLLFNQQPYTLTSVMIESVKDTLLISFHLLVMMMFWLGFMKIAEAGGIVRFLTTLLQRPLRWLFPTVPSDSEAFSYMASNVCFNMLGLSNAATPFGLKAMYLLKENIPAVSTLVILNTSGLAIFPTSLIALRSAFFSTEPSAIVVPVLITSSVTTIVAVVMTRVAFYRKGLIKQ